MQPYNQGLKIKDYKTEVPAYTVKPSHVLLGKHALLQPNTHCMAQLMDNIA